MSPNGVLLFILMATEERRQSALIQDNFDFLSMRSFIRSDLKIVFVIFLSDECSVRKGGCSHECAVAPGKGVVCSCPPGFQIASDGRICEVLDYCTKHLRCSQVCEQHKNTVKCSCYPGWSLGPDGDSCHSTGNAK